VLVSDNEPAAGERLRTRVREDFDVDLVSMDEVGHGADESAELWRGTAADGSSYAVKLSGGGTPAGLLVPAHLAAHRVPGIAAPRLTPAGLLWTEREGRWLSLVPWVSDDRALDGGMGADHWAAYGALLAEVHATAVTDELAAVLPPEDHAHERVASTARVLNSRLHMLTDSDDRLVRDLALEWTTVAGQVTALLERADRLGKEIRTRQAAPSVICHGDPHLGNLLLGGDEQVWLIDWDDAVLAPAERDLMFVLVGVLTVTPQQQSWFFAGYGGVDVDPTRVAYYRCTRALEDVVYPAAQVVEVHRWPESERAEALSILRGVLSPAGLAPLALSSPHDVDLSTR